MSNINKNQKGISLYLVVIIMSIVLAIAFGLGAVLLGQLKTIRGMGDSVKALYAADTGIENVLYNIRKEGNTSNISETYLNSGASYEVDVIDCGSDKCARSFGVFNEVKRAIETNCGVAKTFECGDMLEYEGEYYPTVEIGTQCWFAKNLNVGTMILGSENQDGSCFLIEKYCYQDDENNCDLYGGLYQWNEMMCGSNVPASQGICPSGWHIPTDGEWHDLELYLTDSQKEEDCDGSRDSQWDCYKAGDKLKNDGLCNGRTPCGTSGFEALFGGVNEKTLYYWGLGTTVFFYTSTELGGASCDGCRKLRGWEDGNLEIGVWREDCAKSYGFSIRCIID